MDTELFQILTLFLLLGLLLTLFGVLQSLGAIRRTLERGGAPATAETPEPAAAPEAAPAIAETPPVTEEDQQPLTWARPTEDEAPAESTRAGWPAPQEAASTPEPEPAATGGGTEAATPSPTIEAAPAASAPATDTGARVLYGDTGLTTATPSEAALRTPEPAASEPQQAEAPAAAQSSTQSSTQGSAAEDPQEQPFERDGRWWFRRGDELLVYEEQTGQWVAADGPSASGSAAAPTPASSSNAAVSPDQAGAPEGQVTTQQEAVGSFWKCPSCGAVNGSTATSCRMCFTARP